MDYLFGILLNGIYEVFIGYIFVANLMLFGENGEVLSGVEVTRSSY